MSTTWAIILAVVLLVVFGSIALWIVSAIDEMQKQHERTLRDIAVSKQKELDRAAAQAAQRERLRREEVERQLAAEVEMRRHEQTERRKQDEAIRKYLLEQSQAEREGYAKSKSTLRAILEKAFGALATDAITIAFNWLRRITGFG